jgi:cyclopropane fatty-acyl-phospholipid synthase-like methyltransferase
MPSINDVLLNKVLFNNVYFLNELTTYVQSLKVLSALEVGSRSGEILAILDSMGITCVGVEKDQQACDEAKEYLLKIGARVKLHNKDLEHYTDRHKYGIVFSSGLLEHFSPAESVKMLRQMSTKSSKYVLSLVPNSNCIPYMQEKRKGGFEWCDELDYTEDSLRQLHEDAGLTVVQTGTMGLNWAVAWNKGYPTDQPYLVYALAKVK